MTWNIDSIAQDVRYADRSFMRAPLVAVTIVVTVGLGLGLVAAVYTILNSMIFIVDDVYNPHELFGIERQRSAITEPETFTRAEYETLLRETDILTSGFASTRDVSAWIDGVRREGRLVTGNFFQVLGGERDARPRVRATGTRRRQPAGHGAELSGVEPALRCRSGRARQQCPRERHDVSDRRHHA